MLYIRYVFTCFLAFFRETFYKGKTDFYQDYKDIQRTAKINVPKEAKIGGYSSHHFQLLQESAKIRVNECEYTKNWKNVFADVCIFYF